MVRVGRNRAADHALDWDEFIIGAIFIPSNKLAAPNRALLGATNGISQMTEFDESCWTRSRSLWCCIVYWFFATSETMDTINTDATEC
ncbi:hypothetical protein H2248_002581 [Termitomyces sp. 'cryptogamus']|nr:hypothetical protein H2248_002581 [Termitomyces sp. 'cryptogamus']